MARIYYNYKWPLIISIEKGIMRLGNLESSKVIKEDEYKKPIHVPEDNPKKKENSLFRK